MKKVMIIGAGDFQFPLVKKAAEKYEVVLVAPKIAPEFEPYATAKYFLDVREKEEILKIAQKEQIDAVLTDQTDIPVRTVAYVAEQMGLQGIGYETSKIFTDKALMREKMDQCGIATIPYVKASTWDDVEHFWEQNGGPVIVKPLDTQGSRGVIRVDSLEQLKDAFETSRQFSTNKNVVVEKYIIGPEVVIEGITVDYKMIDQICGDTIYFDDKSKFSAKKRIFPSQKDDKIVKQALELNQQIVKAFGLKHGITHGEYIIDGDQVYLIEIAARGGGVFISSDLIHEETNLDTEEFLLDLALGNELHLDLYDTKKVAGYRAFYLPEGEVMEVTGVDEVKRLPYVRNHQLDKIQVGMKIGKNTDKTSRFAMILVADNYEEYVVQDEQIKKLLHVKVKTDKNYADIIWE